MRAVPRALVCVVGLVAVVAGLPALLVTMVGWPLPHGLPALNEVRSGLADGWRPGERFVLGALALLAWLLWAQLLRHLVAEVRLQRRVGARTAVASPAAGGVSRRLAGWLVAGLMLAGPLPVAALAATPAIPVVLDVTRVLDPPSMATPHSSPAPTGAGPLSLPSYVVHTWAERRDCLWTIAGRYLGDPLRWGQLLELNAEVLQPSGRLLGDDPQHWVYPGMQLRLPAEATGPEVIAASPPPAPAASPAAPDAVQPGAEPATPASPGTQSSAPPATSLRPPPPVHTGPGAGAPTTTAPQARPAQGPASPIRLGRGAMLVAQALALGLPVFAAGGLVRHLNRRRRVQVARHRPGRDIVRPDPHCEPFERRARAIAVDDAAEWVDGTLRVLGARLREASMAAPSITCVRAGEFGLEVLLSEAVPNAPRGFDAVDDGFVWRIDADTELADLRAEAAEHVAAAPALVSIGASPEGPLLVDLEGLGVLSVEGATARVGAFLSGVAIELASAPWSEGIDLRLVGPEPGLGCVEGVSVVDDTASLVDELASLARSNAEALGDSATTLAARLAEPDEPWFPTVVVAGGGSTPAETCGLAQLARPGSGVVLVAPGPLPGATWRLVVVDDGHARLEPLGLVVRAAGAPEPLEVDVGGLDADAIATAAGLLSAASHDDDVAPLVEITAEPSSRRGRGLQRRSHDVWVSVLGPVEISGWAKPVGSRHKYEEVVAYLATHDRPVQGYRLRSKVWVNKELEPKAFREAMSRVRGHLGREARHLPEAARGAYRLADSVGCDWTWFQELSRAAASAARSNPTEAIGLFREALELVRGEPFGGVADDGARYGWAYSELLVHSIEIAITEAADALARLALADDDTESVLWATKQAHLATPGQLSLFDWQMQVARHRLDVDGLNQALRARRAAEQSVNPSGDVPPETMALYERLLGEIRQSRRSMVGS